MSPTREELLFTRAHAAGVNSRFWMITDYSTTYEIIFSVIQSLRKCPSDEKLKWIFSNQISLSIVDRPFWVAHEPCCKSWYMKQARALNGHHLFSG